MTDTSVVPGGVQVVFADANVLYSRVLRDYLLYAADQELIVIAWSARVLAEVTGHLAVNIDGFTAESGARLTSAMNGAFPYAEIEPTMYDHKRLSGVVLPDEDDRHVLAAAVAAEATTLCTANTKDFPASVIEHLGFTVMTPDSLLSALISDYSVGMRTVHSTVVARMRGASDESTIAALRRSGASTAASEMARLLKPDEGLTEALRHS